MKTINVIALILVIIGAINWGLWGLFQFDFVGFIFGSSLAPSARVVYVLIGLAGLWCLSFFKCVCHCCKPGDKSGTCCKK